MKEGSARPGRGVPRQAGTVRPRSEFMPDCPNQCLAHRSFCPWSRALLSSAGPVSLLRSVPTDLPCDSFSTRPRILASGHRESKTSVSSVDACRPPTASSGYISRTYSIYCRSVDSCTKIPQDFSRTRSAASPKHAHAKYRRDADRRDSGVDTSRAQSGWRGCRVRTLQRGGRRG